MTCPYVSRWVCNWGLVCVPHVAMALKLMPVVRHSMADPRGPMPPNVQRFLPCELCQHGISCHNVSVRLTVRLSVTSRSCTKMANPRITLTTPYDSPGTLRFRRQKSRRNSNDIIPNGGANRGGVSSKRRFALRPISRCISETVQDRDTVTMES